MNATPDEDHWCDPLGILQQRLAKGASSTYLAIQGGGAKGGWQAGALSSLLGGNQSLIAPVCCSGSSAGAINSVLVSEFLRTRRIDLFEKYWMRRPELFNDAVGIPRLPKLFWRGAKTLSSALWARMPYTCENRPSPVIPFEDYLEMVGEGLFEPSHATQGAAASMFVYMTGVDVNGPPPVRPNDRTPFMFTWKENATDVEVLISPTRLSVEHAVAASCALPGVEPLRVCESHLADGGIFSNLPIDFLPIQGPLGAELAIFVLATPLSDLDPETSPIDYKTLWMLHDLRAHQENGIRKIRNANPGTAVMTSPVTPTPWFILQPDSLPAAGIWEGFRDPKLMREAIDDGSVIGKRFSNALQQLLSGNRNAVADYHLREMKLPPLPPTQPKFSERWVTFINPSWHGAQLEYPTPEESQP